MFTELRMSSTDISIMYPVPPSDDAIDADGEQRRRAAELVDQQSVNPPSQDDGADHRGEEDEGEGPEGQQVRVEDRVAERLRCDDLRVGPDGSLVVTEGVDQDVGRCTPSISRETGTRRKQYVVQLALRPSWPT